MDPAEQLAALYSEYTGALDKPEYARLRRAPDPGDGESVRIQADLPLLANPASSVAEAMDWWSRHGGRHEGFARMHRLHHLLRRLNRALATVAPFRMETERGLLSLGSPWWATYWREKHGAEGGMPGEIRFSVDG
ncbi:MAG TPA: hypothetical protein VGO40_04335, partial [Longimicrobium sp.]|nr:hypothetical protein [Longimicrobium sp.]